MKNIRTLFKNIIGVYHQRGLKGVFRRAGRIIYLHKKKGISGLVRNLKEKVLEVRKGRYSLQYAYSKNFFAYNLNDSRPMAEYLAPKIIKALNVTSVIDLGCATGHWISAFEKIGIIVLGIEGAENAKDLLVCDPKKVIFADLRDPLSINGHFDMVISIEVAEHIEHKFVNVYTDNMIRFRPKLIMMTAAIPGQGGQFHVNEQEHDYWDTLFLEKGYKRAKKVENMLSGFVEEAKNEPNPPEIMRNSSIKHTGVFIPFWMPRNLLVYSAGLNDFDHLEKT